MRSPETRYLVIMLLMAKLTIMTTKAAGTATLPQLAMEGRGGYSDRDKRDDSLSSLLGRHNILVYPEHVSMIVLRFHRAKPVVIAPEICRNTVHVVPGREIDVPSLL